MVRATFAGFSTALSAIQANQKRLDITGQNLANMNTVGYTRQALQTHSLNYSNPYATYMNGSSTLVGFGVHMDKVTQIRDPYLDAQYRYQMEKSGYTNALQTSLDRLSDIFDESDIQGIHQAFLDIRSTIQSMHDSAKVNDAVFETELRNRMKNLANMLNDASRQIDDAEREEFIRLTGETTTQNGAIDNVNNILQQLGNLNRQIKLNQTLGQQSLELMDERNVLLDELSSYIPIKVTYYKDTLHDGIDNADPTKEDLSETYHLDASGNPMFKKEWPDDVRVEMAYQDENGNTKYITLVEGSEGTGHDNYGSLSLEGDINDPTKFSITFTGSNADLKGNTASITLYNPTNPPANLPADAIEMGVGGDLTNQLADGSIQASLDMLWKNGSADDGLNWRGYEYYREQIDTLASSFAQVMNKLNEMGGDGDLFTAKDGSANITAGNIGINPDWTSGKVHVGTAVAGKDNPSSTDTLLNMLEAMDATYPYGNTNNLNDPLFATIDLKNNTFADFMNHVSTTLADDSYHNSSALKTNVTVLNGIQNSRDSISGVSLDEEASNMMMYMSAYNAASRIMTALDQALDTLINNTGVVGR